MKLTIVIPAYNEEAVITKTLDEVIFYFTERGVDFEVIVVDDGSRDETQKVVSSYPSTRLRTLKHGVNLGKGAAVRTGVLASRCDLILFLDADNSTDLPSFDRCLAAIQEGADIAIGSRRHEGSVIVLAQHWTRDLLGRLGNLLIRAMLLPEFKDTQCGFKLMKSKAKWLFESITINGFAFDLEFLYLAKALGLTVAEVEVKWRNRRDSRVRPLDYAKVFLSVFIIRIKHWTGGYDRVLRPVTRVGMED